MGVFGNLSLRRKSALFSAYECAKILDRLPFAMYAFDRDSPVFKVLYTNEKFNKLMRAKSGDVITNISIRSYCAYDQPNEITADAIIKELIANLDLRGSGQAVLNFID